MVQPEPTIEGLDEIYPEALYYGRRISTSGTQPVYKKLLPYGEDTKLSLEPSQKLHDHSSEFQWGYGGSGPAQLALALLLDATSEPQTALDFYQQFKWDKVATWGEKWSISKSEILIWLEKQKGRQLSHKLNRN